MMKALLNHLGHRYLLAGVILALEHKAVLSSLTKSLYPSIAAQFGVTPLSVDRALRTAVAQCWEHGNRSLLDTVAGRKLLLKPTAGEFIAILTEYARTHQAEDQSATQQT